MPSPDDRSVFARAHEAWAAGDFEGFLSLLDDDIIYIVNVDGNAGAVRDERRRQDGCSG